MATEKTVSEIDERATRSSSKKPSANKSCGRLMSANLR